MDWPANSPLRVSINSFGFGGTNTHTMIKTLSEYATSGSYINDHVSQQYQIDNTSNIDNHRVFCVSAESQNSLASERDALLHHIQT